MDCRAACAARCQLSSRHKLCKRAVGLAVPVAIPCLRTLDKEWEKLNMQLEELVKTKEEDDSIGTPFDEQHILERHITALKGIACWTDAYEYVRRRHNQKHEEVNSEGLEQQ
ncbi:hypothetical protein RJ639_044874 [Escallonia herrerae]|uniref:Uncharacterized protein n=1 Tax=Escallonia herrerae TaxID=1293975 RepID=A0AA88WN05_9ASTE|nr:hypothetical protein RJ639_044874 [Escallonia herrerae]